MTVWRSIPLADETSKGTPQSPEVQESYVREELDQDLITHQGDWRGPTATAAQGHRMMHLGANEDEVVPVIPPMSGPADLVGESGENAQGNESGDTRVGEETLDPRDELTPG